MQSIHYLHYFVDLRHEYFGDLQVQLLWEVPETWPIRDRQRLDLISVHWIERFLTTKLLTKSLSRVLEGVAAEIWCCPNSRKLWGHNLSGQGSVAFLPLWHVCAEFREPRNSVSVSHFVSQLVSQCVCIVSHLEPSQCLPLCVPLCLPIVCRTVPPALCALSPSLPPRLVSHCVSYCVSHLQPWNLFCPTLFP